MSDRMNGVAGHQKDKPSAESDAAESAAAPAPSGAEPAGRTKPRKTGTTVGLIPDRFYHELYSQNLWITVLETSG